MQQAQVKVRRRRRTGTTVTEDVVWIDGFARVEFQRTEVFATVRQAIDAMGTAGRGRSSRSSTPSRPRSRSQ